MQKNRVDMQSSVKQQQHQVFKT